MQISAHFESNTFKETINEKLIEKFNEVFTNFLNQKKPNIAKITKEADLNLIFISDEEIKHINKERRNLDKPTDVLSWKLYEDEITENQIIGEIYISDKYVSDQAKKKGVTDLQEICLLLTHGFLHVCGYTHDEDDTELEMNETTIQLLNQIGIDYSIKLI